MLRRILPLMLLLAACKQTPVATPADDAVVQPDMLTDTGATDAEAAILTRLGVPKDAKRVLILSQSSHLDIDWQKSFENYYTAFVETAFTQAHDLLAANPRARYSIAEMAFLQRHLQQHPEQLAGFKDAAKRGALHIVGGGMTSPDTLLPETELLLRDYLYGIQFAEETLEITPTSAWLPDSFGHSGTAPDVLASLGLRSVAFSRIDGAPTLGQMITGQTGPYPLPGSLAATLKDKKTNDFMWQGPNGGVVLGHFLVGIGMYCEGDNIDYDEPIQIPGGHLGDFKGDDPTFTDAKIDSYIADLTPYAATNYLFVPVGCDFQAPKPRLIEYADGYNQRRYPQTGVWVVAATFDDYAALMWLHAAELPTIQAEMSPVYMGYFGSRADVKRGIRDAARPFLTAEPFAALLGAEALPAWHEAEDAWRLLTRTNHHDFVPGTCADNVVADEQMPMLADLQAKGQAFLQTVADLLADHLPATPGSVARVIVFNATGVGQQGPVEFSLPKQTYTGSMVAQIAGKACAVELAGEATDTTLYRAWVPTTDAWSWTTLDLLPAPSGTPAISGSMKLTLRDAAGLPTDATGAVTVVLDTQFGETAKWQRQNGAWSLVSYQVLGAEAIASPSLRLLDRADDGGLWRMGHEMPGCAVTALPVPATANEQLEIVTQTPQLVRLRFVGATATWEAWMTTGGGGLNVALLTGAAEGTTRTATLQLVAKATDTLVTASPAGWQELTSQKLFAPTFWPAVDWLHVGNWAVLLRQSTGVGMAQPGVLELMAARDARKEKCDVMGGDGSDTGVHRLEWRIVGVVKPADSAGLAQAFARPLVALPVKLHGQAADRPLLSGLAIAAPYTSHVSAIKPASRGGGIILRADVDVAAALQGPFGTRTSTVVDPAERAAPATTTGPLATWRVQ